MISENRVPLILLQMDCRPIQFFLFGETGGAAGSGSFAELACFPTNGLKTPSEAHACGGPALDAYIHLFKSDM